MPSKNWEKFRKPDGSIDLYKAWIDELKHGGMDDPVFKTSPAISFLKIVNSYQPIKSRQAAAVALAIADHAHILWQMGKY